MRGPRAERVPHKRNLSVEVFTRATTEITRRASTVAAADQAERGGPLAAL